MYGFCWGSSLRGSWGRGVRQEAGGVGGGFRCSPRKAELPGGTYAGSMSPREVGVCVRASAALSPWDLLWSLNLVQ